MPSWTNAQVAPLRGNGEIYITYKMQGLPENQKVNIGPVSVSVSDNDDNSSSCFAVTSLVWNVVRRLVPGMPSISSSG